jgi:hypothetical protein
MNSEQIEQFASRYGIATLDVLAADRRVGETEKRGATMAADHNV